MSEVVARLDRVVSFRAPVGGGDDRRQDSGEGDRLVEGRLRERLGGALSRDDGTQRVHRIRRGIERDERASAGVLETASGGHLAA